MNNQSKKLSRESLERAMFSPYTQKITIVTYIDIVLIKYFNWIVISIFSSHVLALCTYILQGLPSRGKKAHKKLFFIQFAKKNFSFTSRWLKKSFFIFSAWDWTQIVRLKRAYKMRLRVLTLRKTCWEKIFFKMLKFDLLSPLKVLACTSISLLDQLLPTHLK